jgi:hypothetical protein
MFGRPTGGGEVRIAVADNTVFAVQGVFVP